MTDKYPPSIKATRLYERTSAKGNPYLTGRWGGLKVALLKTNECDEEGNAIWEMRFSEAKDRKPPARDRGPSAVRELTYTAVDPDHEIIPF